MDFIAVHILVLTDSHRCVTGTLNFCGLLQESRETTARVPSTTLEGIVASILRTGSITWRDVR